MQAVQDPVIPIVGEWTRDNPGTISLGQVWYLWDHSSGIRGSG